MKRNLLLILAVLISLLLIINGTKRILSLRAASQEVIQAEERLSKLKKENEILRKELDYKKSDQFVEGEIRNKLGLSKKGEAVVIVPKDEADQGPETGVQGSEKNWQKWWNLFFGG